MVVETLTAKDVKSRLDDNVLDLSVMQMKTVPVKTICGLKKATHLDLSRNKLETVPEEFSQQMSHLVSLDLASNQLLMLPDNFGDYLQSLQFLYLGENKLETLPLSMGKLRQLKWLDLKDNALTDDGLRKAAGDCVDEKGCRLAAQRVVHYLRNKQAELERRRQHQLDQERKADAEREAKEAAERRDRQQQKKKEKDRKKHERRAQPPAGTSSAARHDEHSRRQTDGVNGKVVTERSKGSGKGDQQKGGLASQCCWSLMKLVVFCVVATLVFFLTGAYALFSNCQRVDKWIPSSEPLCHDLQHFVSSGVMPSSTQKNFKTVVDMSTNTTLIAIDHLIVQIKTTDYAKLTADSVENAKFYTILAVETAQNASVTAWASYRVWFERDARPFMRDAGQKSVVYIDAAMVNLRHYGTIAANRTSVFSHYALEKTYAFADWTSTTSVDVWENPDKYWEKVKHYWNNAK